jgi:hypothetical protein
MLNRMYDDLDLDVSYRESDREWSWLHRINWVIDLRYGEVSSIAAGLTSTASPRLLFVNSFLFVLFSPWRVGI